MINSFRNKEWTKHGNHYHLEGTQINIYQWNSGKNANFLVEAGYYTNNYITKSFPKGENAREQAIEFALSIKDKYLI